MDGRVVRGGLLTLYRDAIERDCYCCFMIVYRIELLSSRPFNSVLA